MPDALTPRGDLWPPVAGVPTVLLLYVPTSVRRVRVLAGIDRAQRDAETLVPPMSAGA
jgi:hypothetical protein